MSIVQHRIFLVRPAPAVSPARVREHWERKHGDIFARTPGLTGYRQNRPVDAEWDGGLDLLCSETWFADREVERSAFASDYYRDVVTPDEASFLERSSAWSAVVLELLPEPEASSPHRVLWFDDSPPTGPPWQRARLSRAVPDPGHGTVVSWTDLDDVDEALTITRQEGPVAFVCDPVAFDPQGPMMARPSFSAD